MSNRVNSSHLLKNNLNLNNESINKPELKLGEFYLTPLESFIINKSMPHGFKLELEENLLKLIESESKERKKNKKGKNLLKYKSAMNNKEIKQNNKNEKKEQSLTKKRINQDFNLDNIPNDISREKYKIAKKCKIGMERIKDSPLAKNFYEFNDTDTPSLSKVEKKLNNYEYNSFYDFEMDIRKIWSYFFYLGEKGDKQIYENTSKMSEKWENICSELENLNVDMHEPISNSVTRREEKNRKELSEHKENNKDKINKSFTNKKDIIKNGNKDINININNKQEITRSMSSEDKNKLGKLIRTNLNKEQLRGIAKILMGKDDVKVLEFDMDQLPYEQLKKLEKYVYDCAGQNMKKLNSNNNNNGTNIKNNNNKNNDINNNNINNKQNKNEKENEINNKEIKNKEKEEKKIEEKNEINKNVINNNEKIENKIVTKKENEENKNKENDNINKYNNEPINNRDKDKDSLSDSLSSDSSLSD